jgi:DNA-binding NarL/FixJ family response regulator
VAPAVSQPSVVSPRRAFGFRVFYFITWAAVALRFLISTIPEFGFPLVPAALLAAYLVLSACLPWLSVRRPVLPGPFFVLQAAGASALAAAAAKKPDVVLMDLVMPVMDGVEATRKIRAGLPDVRVIELTSFVGEDKVFPALRAGAAGYLLKDVEPPELADTLRAVARGESRLAPDIQKQPVTGIAGPGSAADVEALTPREEDVLRRLARGRSNREIGADLFIAEKTVKTHISSILAKLRLEGRTQAAVYAVKHGLE